MQKINTAHTVFQIRLVNIILKWIWKEKKGFACYLIKKKCYSVLYMAQISPSK